MKPTTCDTCQTFNCKKGIDCYGISTEAKEVYGREEILSTSKNASLLIDNGRAGTLTRLEEIIEFCKLEGYKKIGLAYCIAFANEAKELSEVLRSHDFIPIPVICTTGGIKEREIDTTKTKETVSCNPIGQSILIKKQEVDFIIEFGLCLGHDVLFHKDLNIPFTVFFVKDRILNHAPMKALKVHKSDTEKFIDHLDSSFAMKSPKWLEEKISSNEKINILDLRGPEAFKESHIPGSKNVLLKDLPEKLFDLQLNKAEDIICVCNGSVQSAYAIMYLFTQGYSKVHNLSGGFSRWQKEGYATKSL